MRILGIETSCDETAAAVVEDGTHVLSNVIASAKDAFLWSGGVIPEEAARKQVECILPVITQALSEAHISHKDLDAIAVTKGPGLLGSLIVGTVTARILSAVWQKPIIGIHHHLGHLSSTWLREKSQIPESKSQKIFNSQFSRSGPEALQDRMAILNFPVLTLTVSGGHTELWLRTAHTSGELLGRTRDDAAGEAFDKGACLLGLPYPGGPAIAKAAEGGNPHAFDFPLPLKGEDTLDFSFSGLKTSLKYLLRDLQKKFSIFPFEGLPRHRLGIEMSPSPRARASEPRAGPNGNFQFSISDVAASYQHAICRHLFDRTVHALAQYPAVKEIHLVGGVSANTHLHTFFKELHTTHYTLLTVRWPVAIAYCTDNAAMIAAAAEFLVTERGWPNAQFATNASLPLTDVVKNG